MKHAPVLFLIATTLYATTAERATLAAAAAGQVGVTRHYDPSYVPLRYPGGDVPPERGVCADVIVRSFRRIGVDLQVAVHEDMQRNFVHNIGDGAQLEDVLRAFQIIGHYRW